MIIGHFTCSLTIFHDHSFYSITSPEIEFAVDKNYVFARVIVSLLHRHLGDDPLEILEIFAHGNGCEHLIIQIVLRDSDRRYR
jgi:hypothetical protein